MPSTTSSSVSKDFASSTVMTPSLPTFFIASARNWPISVSPFAEIVPTCAISWLDVTFFESFCKSATTASTARSTPRLRSIGFIPAATALEPSLTMACARTVAVVVPSPAKSEDLDATSRTICAPMFSNLSSSSISFATVTPSLLMRGAPNDLSSTTLRPLGPSVTRTALVRMSTPRNIRSRASTENFTSLAAILLLHGCTCDLCGLLAGGRLIEHAHDVALLHDEVIDAVDLDLRAGPFSKQHAVASLQVDRYQLAVLVAATGTDGDDLALGGFLLRGIGNDDPACALFFGVDALNHDAVVKRTKLHKYSPNCCVEFSPGARRFVAGEPNLAGGVVREDPCDTPILGTGQLRLLITLVIGPGQRRYAASGPRAL